MATRVEESNTGCGREVGDEASAASPLSRRVEKPGPRGGAALPCSFGFPLPGGLPRQPCAAAADPGRRRAFEAEEEAASRRSGGPARASSSW